ncbi:hypothetical protein [Aquimarina sp. RZ0]|uniref:hypothetical protein n=1 Tax=Aquimarina sp. RZ0 TaxID=2607730 RepID=UPI00165F1997|nr:hypothetical protein [Aquimarina sp. RZ0]
MENGYQYEPTYAAMMKKIEQDMLQLSAGKVPKGKNSKKLYPQFRQIEISKS